MANSNEEQPSDPIFKRRITEAVKGRYAVIPSEICLDVGMDHDGCAPPWVRDHLKSLGYFPTDGGFFWKEGMPLRGAIRFKAFLAMLDEAYPSRDCR